MQAPNTKPGRLGVVNTVAIYYLQGHQHLSERRISFLPHTPGSPGGGGRASIPLLAKAFQILDISSKSREKYSPGGRQLRVLELLSSVPIVNILSTFLTERSTRLATKRDFLPYLHFALSSRTKNLGVTTKNMAVKLEGRGGGRARTPVGRMGRRRSPAGPALCRLPLQAAVRFVPRLVRNCPQMAPFNI